jgi:hypothetical protein
MPGFSVRIFTPSGDPAGILFVEKSNWTGQGIVFPRALFAEARKRRELDKAGVYILHGPGESGQLPRLYIGEGDGVLPRLEQHVKNKDFWTHAVVFTSKDFNLNKAHIQYLESRLVQLAGELKRCELDNAQAPQPPALSEADRADAEAFMEDMLLCLPFIALTSFEKSRVPQKGRVTLFVKGRGVEAKGWESPGGFEVLKGSEAAREEVPSVPDSIRDMRQALLKHKVIADVGGKLVFQQDYQFSSPSMAAGVILGRSSNGRTEWKDAKGRSLKEIQEAAVAE